MEPQRDLNIRIAIADDHHMVINGIEHMLHPCPHISVSGIYQTAGALLEGLQQEVPDVLLLDIQLPDQYGDELLPTLLKQYPSLRVLTLTNFDNTFYIKNMMRRGALGYLLKSTDQKTLIEAIETVYTGRQFLPDTLRQRLVDDMLKTRKQGEQPQLTWREKEILQLIANGCTSQEIADKLFLSHHTVNNHRLNLIMKLDVKNVAELVKKAVQLGLVE
jgi:DNA-binding NarL/FixJ family response regulator